MVRISFFTCVFLVCLRLVIGWHFFFEGLDKYESRKNIGAENAKPFSSAGYFAEAEGPLGPTIRGVIGDPDQIALAKLTLVDGADKLPQKMPPAVAAEWDDYARQFVAFYHLSDEKKKEVDQKLEDAKIDYVEWLSDKKPGKKVDADDDPRKNWIVGGTVGEPAIIYRPEAKVSERIATYRKFVDKVRADFHNVLPLMGRDVEQLRLRTLKNKTAEARADLMKSVDDHTKKLKESLAKVVDGNLTVVEFGPTDNARADDVVLAMLTLAGNKDATIDSMPAALGEAWDKFAAFAQAQRGDAAAPQIDASLKDAKLRYVRFLLDLDPYTGEAHKDAAVKEQIEKYRQMVEKRREAERADTAEKSSQSKAAAEAAARATASLRQEFVDAIRLNTDIMRYSVGAFKAEKSKDVDYDTSKGLIETQKQSTRVLGQELPSTPVEWLDAATRWGLLIAGGCLLIGLFTRLACLYCVCFLAIEVLSNTALPWLPTSPKSEGHYTFVNKNVVELFALLTLMTLPTGRWLGVDAILSRLWPFRRRPRENPAR